jgi:hypothetical protein
MISAGKPRILMVGPLTPPVGGMATVVENLAQALAQDTDIRVLNNVKTTPTDRSLTLPSTTNGHRL